MNWTDDSWSVQENVVVTVASEALAHAFTLDFEELWGGADVEHSGFVEPRPVDVDGVRVRPWFTPGFADALTARIAKKIGHAEKVRILSPVITSAPVLGDAGAADRRRARRHRRLRGRDAGRRR